MFRSETAKTMDGSKYSVLLIITDGVIDDMRNTIQAIIKARPIIPSTGLGPSICVATRARNLQGARVLTPRCLFQASVLPLSIIIIGVGNENFKGTSNSS